MSAAPAPTFAQPVLAPDASVMKLDEIGIYEVGYAYRGQPEKQFPLGWSGSFDDQTGIACQPAGEQNGKQAFLIHCPWRNGTGITFQQFRFRLPRVRRILLRGATAMRADAVGKSDGATFRVYVNGKRQLEENRKDSVWRPFDLDLTPLAGQIATVRFETDPGPEDNPSFDFSLWGDRALVLSGFRPAARLHPAPPPLGLSPLVGAPHHNVFPVDGYRGTGSVSLQGDIAVFTYAGKDGSLQYRWTGPSAPGDPALGRIVLKARMRGDRPVEVPLAGAASVVWTSEAEPGPSSWTHVSGGVVCVRHYRVGGTDAKLEVSGRLEGKSLILSVACDKAVIRMLDGGGWGPVMRRRNLAIPYYGSVQYLPKENLFVNALLDWTHSNATSQEGTKAQYGALTDGRLNLLREQIAYTASWNVDEALPSVPNPPSPYRKDLAGRTVLDIWGGRYVDIAHDFERLKAAGIDDCVALIHVWQRSGYDNALPMHLPAMAELGGDAGMKTLVSTGTRLGYRVALHENYVDYYPNYDLFNPDDIALDSAGNRQLAWYNPGTKIQSFAERPDAILRLAGTQSPEIHRRFGTNADYLDVHSAVPPWFHVDMRADAQRAGEFSRVWDVHRQLWGYERKTHGGPVFGEGANHWYWSGCLDGVEAQFGVGWPANQGLTAPLMVDFDLLKIHPLQLNHGMGYYERWWSNARWGAVPPMVVLDQYRMQEAAYGHAGFLAASTWNMLPLAWLEHNLLAPVTARCATTPVTAIRYQIAGRWVDSTTAARAGEWNRVRVSYANGLTITANSARSPLQIGGLTLPQFGWYAQGAGVTAYTATKSGALVDYCETPDSVFANARRFADWNVTGIRRIRPQVASFEQTGPREFRAAYRWRVGDSLGQDYSCFVHFSSPGGQGYDEKIRFQQDHALQAPTSSWKAGEQVADGPYDIRIPQDAADGDYEWSIGLFAVGGGGRLSLEGVDDGHGRIRLGILRLSDSGRKIAFLPEKGTGDERLALFRQHLNESGTTVDFGPVRTVGGVLVRREGAEWVLRAMPQAGAFLVELDKRRFGSPSRILCEDGPSESVAPIPAGRFWRLPLNGAATYRWPAGPRRRTSVHPGTEERG